MEKTDLSIIIVNYNTKNFLRRCLDSLNFHGEVIVVDNSSSDGSSAMVVKEFPQVKLIKNKKNLGFAKANNLAIKESSGRYILFFYLS